ncbi:MAG: RHS repeat-associated core domain-containing protein [Methylococcaceae bacterium]|nr:RHS repeat-associated core domain-containing protein [Methylococcaceae bacterium]
MGNRKTEIQNGTTYVYCYHVSNCNAAPKGNRLINIRTGSATGPLYRQFDYDDSGRLLRKRNGAGTALYNVTYNGKGRAKAINGNSFAYDPNDYRIKRQNSLYLLEGEHLEATYTSAGVLQNKYLRGVVVDEIVNGYTYHSDNANDWTNYTFHHDHLNSVTALTGHAGSTKESNRYDAFGAILNLSFPGTGNEQLFTGRQLDVNTGLYYYRARYYDAEIGRFISEDPLGFQAGVNFYAYVGNNPVNFNDPSGLVRWGDLGNASLGLFSGGSGVVVGGATVLGGAGLFATNPIAGSAVAVFGATVFTNSAANIALNGRRFVDALIDVRPSVPGNFPEVIANQIAPGNVNAILLANAANLGLDLASGSVPVGLMPDLASAGSALQSTRLANFSELANYNAASRSIGNLPVDIAVPGASAVTRAVNVLQGAATAQTVNGVKEQVINNLSNVAGGGFVLYPSKPNTNALHSVYTK